MPVLAPYEAQDPRARSQAVAKARTMGLRVSVKKMNVVAKLVRRLHIDDATIQLALINEKKAARMLLKARARP